jgi:hypothetical protein
MFEGLTSLWIIGGEVADTMVHPLFQLLFLDRFSQHLVDALLS